MGRGFAPALIGIVAGTALQLAQAQLWPAWVYAAALAFGVAAAWAATRTRNGLFAFFAAAVFALSLTGLRSLEFQSHALDAQLEGRDIPVTGVIAAMPQRTDGGLRFRFEVESPASLPPQIYLGWWANAAVDDAGSMELSSSVPELHAGDRWRFNVRLKAPHGNVNPHGFDYELWLWEQGLQATGYVRSGAHDPKPVLVADTWWHPVERARQSVRDAVFRAVDDRKSAGILAALIAGDQNAIERPDWDIFRATGVAHLMSISGLHITMFAWLAALIVGWCWRRSARLCIAWPAPHAALVGGVALAAAYALFSGWGVPAQRTIWMLGTAAVLRMSGRRWPWTHVWLLTCAVVVTIDPWAMMQAGFWLSFVAVGVLFATDPGHANSAAKNMREKIVRSFRASLHEQCVVTVALTPLTLLLFGQVSVVGLLANAIAIPWVTLVVTPLAMAGVAFHPLWDAAAKSIAVLQVYLEWLATLPFATVSMPAAPLWAGALGVCGGLLVAMKLPWHARLLGVPLLLPVLLWQPTRPGEGQFEVMAVDIGQGNALLVRTAAHTLMYDTGPRYSTESDAGHRVLVPLLRAFDENVDMLMLSHRDSDHTGGAPAVLAMQLRTQLVSSLEDAHPLQSIHKSERCIAGRRWQWDGVDFEVLHPQTGDYAVAAKPNAMSCVLRISNGARTALLAGDLEAPQEGRLVEQHAPLRADLLLVPHHGSKTSSSNAFLDAVHPSFALVQAGYRNRFGHPAPPVMERYRQRAIAVVDSPHCGAARWSSSAPDHVACERDESRRYWMHRVR